MKIIDQLSNCPDMNPIEYFWDQIEVHIRDMDDPPTMAALLRVTVQQVWVALKPVMLRTLVQSMPCHLRAVLAAWWSLFLLWTLFINTCFNGTP